MSRGINKLSIDGFKSIRALHDLELSSLNVLIGPNGAGKSNFVSFFEFLHALVEQDLGGYVETRGGADKLLYLGPKVSNSIRASLEFSINGYEITLKPTAAERFVFDREVATFEGDSGKIPHSFGKGHGEAKLKGWKDKPGLKAEHGIPYYVYEAVSSWKVYHFHDTSALAGMRRSHTTRNYETLEADAGNIAAFLLKLRDADRGAYESIRDTVRLVAPFFDDFKLRPRNSGPEDDTTVLLEWGQKGTSYPFHPSQLSDGTLRFVCLATALLQPDPPATVIIDEPELGLHPFALGVLAETLREASSRTQVIVSTQSATLLDHFEPNEIVVVERRNGASVFRRLHPKELREWRKEYSMGEIWQKNVFEGGPTFEAG